VITFIKADSWTVLAPIVTQNRTWRALAAFDIRSKYRRTSLGPWWITISNALFALIIGLVSGRFLGSDMTTYLPFFVTGLTIWNFIGSGLVEGSQTLILAGGMIKASNLPIAFYVLRMVHRNFIILMHNILVVPVIWLFLPWPVSWTAIYTIFGFATIYVFVTSMSLIVGIVCTRYRDIPPIVQAVVQLLFFVSPIIWMPDQLRGGQLVLAFNPIAHLLSLARDPLLSRPVSPETWLIAFGTAILSAAIASAFYVRYRTRVVYWT
jgi:lipopolysaccharide transport system permease protein